jgi:dienelactone hydrolase
MHAARSLVLVVLAPASAVALAQPRFPAWTERVEIDIAQTFDRRAALVGELRIPASDHERLPAVVIVNSSSGFDGRSAFYAEGLNAAGIASFEVDMFQGRGIPPWIVANMPHAFQALRWLARHPRVDGARVGIMGVSYGGQVAMLAASDAIVRTYAEPGQKYAAHLANYPQCRALRGARAAVDKYYKATFFDTLTGRPVHVLVGDRDGYGSLATCREFLDALPAASKPFFAMTVYEGATFGWDYPFSNASYEATADRGRGAIVTATADPEVSRKSREFAVSFFARHLAAP